MSVSMFSGKNINATSNNKRDLKKSPYSFPFDNITYNINISLLSLPSFNSGYVP